MTRPHAAAIWLALSAYHKGRIATARVVNTRLVQWLQSPAYRALTTQLCKLPSLHNATPNRALHSRSGPRRPLCYDHAQLNLKGNRP